MTVSFSFFHILLQGTKGRMEGKDDSNTEMENQSIVKIVKAKIIREKN